jgi:hypothetical protein
VIPCEGWGKTSRYFPKFQKNNYFSKKTKKVLDG